MAVCVRCIVNRLLSKPTRSIFRRQLHFTPYMAEKELAELKHNPYYDKYAARISQLQKENPAEFIEKLESNFARKAESKFKEGASKTSTVSGTPRPPKPDITNTTSLTKPKKLSDVMKVELLQDKTPEQITQIWTEYYKNKSDTICAVMPAQNYEKIYTRAAEFNTFVFALPRDEGYEFVLSQFAVNEFHFTTLINYQAFGENAPECLTIVYYTDMEAEKGITLMRGEFDSKLLGPIDAQFLANQIQLYYASSPGRHLELLQQFKHSPATWSHEQVIQQLEHTNFIST